MRIKHQAGPDIIPTANVADRSKGKEYSSSNRLVNRGNTWVDRSSGLGGRTRRCGNDRSGNSNNRGRSAQVFN